MTIKPFAIQGSDLTLGGINIQAGTDSIVIPGITQVTNYVVEEVDENDTFSTTITTTITTATNYGTTPSSSFTVASVTGIRTGSTFINLPGGDFGIEILTVTGVIGNGVSFTPTQTFTPDLVLPYTITFTNTGDVGGQDLGSDETAVTVIDNAEYLYLVDDGDSPSADYVAATYRVDELDELGNIKEIDVETEGVFLTADKSRAEAANMWATLDPTPFVSFSAGNWTQIPFRPKMRAGEVENVGGGNADTGNFTFNEDTITNSDGMKLTTNRGTLAMGTNMEVPGVAQHFHIAFDGSNSCLLYTSPSPRDQA